MPTPTPDELQRARRASGRLGGRPRKPTRDEARERALEDLVPKALKVLGKHLGDGENVNAESWRAALRVFEFAFGRPPDEARETSRTGIENLSVDERRNLCANLIEQYPQLLRRYDGDAEVKGVVRTSD
jgi:hypothetical protein